MLPKLLPTKRCLSDRAAGPSVRPTGCGRFGTLPRLGGVALGLRLPFPQVVSAVSACAAVLPLFFLACLPLTAQPSSAPAPALPGQLMNLAQEVRSLTLDPSRCYRVRDLSLIREDLKLFLTDGYVTFSKPVAGRPVALFFSADVEGGDAELMLLPPSPSERRALNKFAQTPNLNEHFKALALIFTDGTHKEVEQALTAAGTQPAPERGALYASQHSETVQNLARSFETRVVADLAGERGDENGLFFAAIGGTRLGSFDVIFDPQGYDQITVGQLVTKDEQVYYDVWSAFQARAFRQGRRTRRATDFRVPQLSLEAELNETLHLTTKARLQIEVTRPNLRVLVFDLSSKMNLQGATIDGQPAEILERESLRANVLRAPQMQTILLSTGQPLPPGRHEVEVRLAGDVVRPVSNGVYSVDARGLWYPHHGLQYSQAELLFRHPKRLQIVASGELVEEKTEGESRVARWRTLAPARIIGFNLGDFKRSTVEQNGIKVSVYANSGLEAALQSRRTELVLPPSRSVGRRTPMEPVVMSLPQPDPAQARDRLARDVADNLAFFSAQLGPPPVKSLSVSPIPGAFGQGFPGLIYLSTLSYLDPKDRPAFAKDSVLEIFFSDLLLAHEVAHQWWGNHVATSNYQDDWLMEALANYSALQLLERRRGPKAMQQILENYRQNLLRKTDDGTTIESVGPISWGARLQNSTTRGLWRIITYEKGTWIIHMLRRRLGDKAFQELLLEIQRDFAQKEMRSQDFFQRAARKLPPGDKDPRLESFLDTWVESTGIPKLRLVYKPGQNEALLEQSGVPDDFSLEVPVEVTPRTGKAELVWVRTDGTATPVRWKSKGPITKVVLDPNSSILTNRD